MTTAVQRRRGTDAEHASFTGLDGEITVNTTSYTIHVHDGVTAGGNELALADGSNISTGSVDLGAITATTAELNYTDGVTSNIQTQLNAKAPIASPTFTGTTTIPTADINGGTIDGTVIGGTTAAAISGTTASFSGDLAVDTDTLFVDVSTDNVGIGTTNPAVPLDIVTKDNEAISLRIRENVSGLAALQFTDNPVTAARGSISASATELSFDSPTAARITTAGVERINISSAGATSIQGLTVGLGGGAISTNTANGYQALYSNTTGGSSTANGYQALFKNTTGGNNTANGFQALHNNTTGNNNTANGYRALYNNTIGYYNTANGSQALYNNTIGVSNTAVGDRALLNNSTGNGNTANGSQALLNNTTAEYNTANGYQALTVNTTGGGNVSTGYRSLFSNVSGALNVATGYQALYNNTTGNANTAVGINALYNCTTGAGNIQLGGRTAAGASSPVFSVTTENNRVVMGSTAVTNAYVQVAWTVVSDARDKTDFAPVPHGLDFVTQLEPTAYRYKETRDATEGHGPLRYGFKAQDVLALEGDTPVIVDADDPEKLRFNDQAMIAVLVNAIKDQQSIINTLTARIDALEAK